MTTPRRRWSARFTPPPNHWNEISDNRLGYSHGWPVRLVRAIVSFPLFALGTCVLFLPFIVLLAKTQPTDDWWLGFLGIIVVSFGAGGGFAAIGLLGMFYRQGMILDLSAQTCILWWRFLWWHKTDVYSLSDYDDVKEIEVGSALFGSLHYSPQLTGSNVPPVCIYSIHGAWDDVHVKTSAIRQFLWP